MNSGSELWLELEKAVRFLLSCFWDCFLYRPPEMKAEILSGLEETLWERFASGEVRPIIHATLPMSEAEAAHAILERQENLGKVVLTVS